MSTRIHDASAIESRLLELVHTTDAKITAPALAYYAPCSIDDAARVLDDLTARDRLTMDVQDDGTIIYHMPGRQKFTETTHRPAARPSFAPEVLPVRYAARGPSPVAAAALSMLIPGAGHLYAGRIASAVLWFLVVSLGYVLLLPGLVLHLFNIASAAATAHRIEAARARPQLSAYSA